MENRYIGNSDDLKNLRKQALKWFQNGMIDYVEYKTILKDIENSI